MSSFLDFDGIYDNKRKFAVTNWSDEEIKVNWKDETGDNWYTLHAGEVKTYPMYLAYYITKIFVDREMFKAAAKIPNNPDGTPSRTRERMEMAAANKELRKPYEDKTMQEVIEGRESPEVTAMRAKIRAELIVEGKLPAEQAKELVTELHNNVDGSAKTESDTFATVPKKRGRRTSAETAAGV